MTTNRFTCISNMKRKIAFALICIFGVIIPAYAYSGLKIVSLPGGDFKYYIAEGKESLYAISKKYNLPLDSLQKWNPDLAGEIKKGEKLFWPGNGFTQTDTPADSIENIIYVVKWGDTFPSIASQFNTTVADIFRTNPTLTPSTLRQGNSLKIASGSAKKLYNAIPTKDTIITTFHNVIARKGDSWEGIARTNRITADLLKKTNPEVSEIKKNTPLSVPVIEEQNTIKYEYKRDIREITDDGVLAIYNEVNQERNYQKKHSSSSADRKVITILLFNPSTNKDIDFSRGFLLALSQLGRTQLDDNFDIRFVDASKETGADHPDIAAASIIVATCEKEFPSWLSSLADSKKVINVFDLKNDAYLQYPGLINILQSPELFNKDALKLILQHFGDAQFVFFGDPLKANDALASELMSSLSVDHFEVVDKLDNVVAPYSGDFIIYSLASKKDEISSALKEIGKFIADNPDHSNISTIGRPSWIMYLATMGEAMQKANTFFPSRFFLNEDNPITQQYADDYKKMWGKLPVKSFPQYASMGYDTAKWLINNEKGLQIVINLEDNSENIGKVNHSCMLIHLDANGTLEIINSK